MAAIGIDVDARSEEVWARPASPEEAKRLGIGAGSTVMVIDEAKERLIRTRATHLDALVARLHEPRVERVIEPIVAGTWPGTDTSFDDDVSYVHDLGLSRGPGDLEIANPIYREVLLRVLGHRTERFVKADPRSFVRPDGRFDLARLLQEFVVFWREHGAVLIQQEGYHEAACQIILMAFLHRLVNGGGHLDREYAAGTERLDVLIRWPHTGPDGERLTQREAMELKVWRPGENDPKPEGLAQLDRHLDRSPWPPASWSSSTAAPKLRRGRTAAVSSRRPHRPAARSGFSGHSTAGSAGHVHHDRTMVGRRGGQHGAARRGRCPACGGSPEGDDVGAA
ncbi:UTRA domain-containing protein [Nonomuraea sp. KC401]|uniref:UTRA domain-containing protein n=1 Tax=unclassified Nonomuraea TaxID=2593643 RepID=UPI0010FD6C84|nr:MULTISPECIES: UTRA domain-containing protein [unclassified Nonomuraea]NBE96987.1 hypothetical protein [Nonomuraea sp. K271]TLF66264.1 UTRA domain-containing protein [Nonomuraea sp. KC401]